MRGMRKLALISALALIAALFAGCAQSGATKPQSGLQSYSPTKYEPIYSDKFSGGMGEPGASDGSDSDVRDDPDTSGEPAVPKSEDELRELLLEGIRERREIITGLGTDSELALSVAFNISYDHPELFWFQGKGFTNTEYNGDSVTDVTYEPQYTYTADEIAAYQTQLEKITASVVADLGGKSDYEKVKGVFDYVVDSIDYGGAPSRDCNVAAGLVDHTGVCSAYAASVQYLCQQLGLESRNITGADKEDGFFHAWAAVKVEGEWYYVDATSGDMMMGDLDRTITMYDYLLMTTEQMEREYVIVDGQDAPECTATTYNYHVYNDLYLETYSYSEFATRFVRELEDSDDFTIRFGSKDEYDRAIADLIDNKCIVDAYNTLAGQRQVPELSSLRFVRGAEQYTLRVLFA